jgi:hypothetical protein
MMEECCLADAHLASKGSSAEGVRAATAEHNDGCIDDGGACIAAGHGTHIILTDRSVNI